MSPQKARKMQSECSWPKAVRAASSTIWILIRPMSRSAHSPKTAQRKSPQAAGAAAAGGEARRSGVPSRPGQAEPDQEPFGREEPAPLLVEERAVGLQAIGD